MATDLISATETLLAHLICADALGDKFVDVGGRRGLNYAEMDAGVKLQFPPIKPQKCYTFEQLNVDDDIERDEDRLYTMDASLLLNPVQDLLGPRAEIAMICNDRIKWTGFKRINKPPRGVWVAARGASLYEVHYREVFESGMSTYYRRVAAITKTGAPVPCLITGSNGKASGRDGEQLVLAASVIEDAHRPNAFTASIKDSTEVLLPVPIGEHKDLFALREAPLTPNGRRKAILHWVASHMRRSKENKPHEVAAHLRGVRQFSIDGMTVTLSPNGIPA